MVEEWHQKEVKQVSHVFKNNMVNQTENVLFLCAMNFFTENTHRTWYNYSETN